MDKEDEILEWLTNKNYMNWSFHLQNFVQGHGQLGILDGSDPMPIVSKPTDKDDVGTMSKSADEKTQTTWRQNNANS